jgi:DNA-binding response OmpR family regulator
MLPLLAVDGDIDVYNRESATWEKHGVANIRVATMHEALEKLADEDFVCVAINADSVNYLPQLKIMRDAIPVPIIIMSSSFSTEREVEALYNGADSYNAWRDTPEENVMSAIAVLTRYAERSRQRKKNLKILSYGDMMVIETCKKVFIRDEELALTRTEYNILHYLMANRGRVMEYKQIYRHVYRGDFNAVSPNVLYSTVKRLRKKISDAAGEDYVENVRDTGYRLPANYIKKQG